MSAGLSFADASKGFLPVRQLDYRGMSPKEAIAAIAERRSVQPLSDTVRDQLIVLNGQMVKDLRTGENYEPVPLIQANPPEYFSTYADSIGTYHTNNGTIALVAHDGQMMIGRVTPQLINAVETAGYLPKSMHVPMSNGETFVSPSFKTVFEKLSARQRLDHDLVI